MALRLRLGRRLWMERLALGWRWCVAWWRVAPGTAAVAIGMVAAVAGMAEAEDITTNAVGAVPAEHHRRQAVNVFHGIVESLTRKVVPGSVGVRATEQTASRNVCHDCSHPAFLRL